MAFLDTNVRHHSKVKSQNCTDMIPMDKAVKEAGQYVKNQQWNIFHVQGVHCVDNIKMITCVVLNFVLIKSTNPRVKFAQCWVYTVKQACMPIIYVYDEALQ